MDHEARLLRRERARRRARRRRRVALGAVVAAVLGGALVGGLRVLGSGGDDEEAARRPAPRAELPGGGRRILPGRRVVAFYGAPQDQQLGALGIGSPDAAARRLRRQARPYARRRRPVLPAFELIAAIATAAPGEGGNYSDRLPARTIDRYLHAARRHRSLLVLDIQPGHAPFTGEARALERWLREPEVSLALDPEWSLPPGQVPGRQIGSTDAATINEVSRYLSRIVRERDLPQKLLVVHRFTRDMIRDEAQLERHPGVALVVNVDGFGDRANKVAKYREFTRGVRGRFHGFKLFYEEDTGLMSPRRVLGLRPPPDIVVYE